MRSLEQAKESWQEIRQYQTVRDLKDAMRLDQNSSSAATRGLRSLCWKTFLLFGDTLDVVEWQRTLTSSRSAYNSLRSHFFRYLENPDDIGAGHDPLSQDSESSPWSQAQQDDGLRAEILQDVERCMPENDYFRRHDIQAILLDILFVFCKLNPDVGYRQGMHEIAAPILWVIHNDAIDIGDDSRALGEDAVIRSVFDAEHIEHDTFALFGQVMQNAKTFYISEGPVSIASRSRHIFDELLPLVDGELMKHLESLDVVPQVYLIRWIRLLFGREFDFDSVLTLWDVLLAEDSTLELVDYVCIAMLLRIRWHLLGADYNNALGILLRYPELEKDLPAQTFGLDALYLKTHINSDGGGYLVLKYTGRPPTSGRPTTPPALQRNITTFAVQRRHKMSPTRTPRSQRNIEAMLQTTAKNLYARGEKLGIGKAVRSAVDEVHKKAQEIRDSQTIPARPGSGLLVNRIRDLELRNRRLSELLAGAVSELWEYQRLVSAEEGKEEQVSPKEAASIAKLSAAVAKVQFVQVYLDEPTLALPEEETAEVESATVDPEVTQSHSAELTHDSQVKATNTDQTKHKDSTSRVPVLADPSKFEEFAEEKIPQPTKNPIASAEQANSIDPVVPIMSKESDPPTSSPTRPSLEQSSFSYMLGQDSTSGSSRKTSTPPRGPGRAGVSLFGDDSGTRSNSRRFQGVDPLSSTEPDDDVFDLGSLRRAKRMQ